ncbi:hypothetical protein HELRODRAFT_191935 [Helobdella robusta]|uniref:Exostosin GT47 domain-containing protein n=1 Tax=Helobdella robusta TaxID=6412 RepID=T1FTF2_HELRO|nr:hypothetical protein HELRODRAFT_191935 [Helobdella robusta]ESO03715.1 hypothetical protein HELRODRAFT_191935 [Helobdella robusta]
MIRRTKRMLVLAIVLFYAILICSFCIVKYFLSNPNALTRAIGFYRRQSESFIYQNINPWVQNVQMQPIDASGRLEHFVEVWGDINIGCYLQYDILNSDYRGVAVFENFKFNFYYGTEEYSNYKMAKIIIYVGNGRSRKHVKKTRKWLNYLYAVKTGQIYEVNDTSLKPFTINQPLVLPRYKTTYSYDIGLILIGDELCNNAWLDGYSHVLSFTFVTYNAVQLNDKERIYRWPLGVARSFPSVKSIRLKSDAARPYFCNFIATIYPKSSRQQLLDEIHQSNETSSAAAQFFHSFIISTRDSWSPNEEKSSAQFYQKALMESDFTLCLDGLNEETYRVYEAISMGSIPIVEDAPPNFQMPEHAGSENFCYDSNRNEGIVYNYSKVKKIKSKNYPATIADDFLLSDGSYYYDRSLGVIVSNDDATYAPKLESKFKVHNLLKQYKAPVLFVDKVDVPMLKRLKSALSPSVIRAWRRSLALWYQDFRSKYREKLVDVINDVIADR